MNHLAIFILRAVLGSVIAVIIARTFRPDGGLFTVAGLSILLVGTAYLLDYFRKKHHGE